MSDKDQFTFDDGDDFPETDLSAADDGDDFPEPDLSSVDDGEDFPEGDLSSAFSDGEIQAEHPVSETPEEAAPAKIGKKAKPAKTDGGSRTRVLLIILLLVVAGGAGAYYFMGLGETTPSVPTAPVPAQQAKTTVALPPQPAKPAPAAAQPVAEPAKPVTVAVPPPPPPEKKVEEPVPPPTKAAPDTVMTDAAKAAQPVATPATAPAAKTETPQPVAKTEPASQAVAMPAKPAPPAASPEAAPPAQVADGAFALDAGSYLFESNRDALIAKIKKLGYEPLVTPVDATLDMTRLRLGTFNKDEVQEALNFARSIEPGSYSAPAGDNYVIYAGTFLSKGNIDKLTKRFEQEGVKVYPEPVQVVRTLSRIRFGSFANKADAEAAAGLAGGKGVKAVVVKAQ